MNLCTICDKTELFEQDIHTQICAPCRNTLGIVPMPPPRRRALPCRSCNAMRFIRVIPREYSSTGGEFGTEMVAPMTATTPPEVAKKLLFGGNSVSTPSFKTRGVGLLEIYICTACGAAEWHCQNPESIPIGPAYMTDVVDYSQTLPYR